MNELALVVPDESVLGEGVIYELQDYHRIRIIPMWTDF